MNSRVTPAVTTPSSTQAANVRRVKSRRRGRTTTSSSTPAQASRSQAAPSAPRSSISPTDAASPSWTHEHRGDRHRGAGAERRVAVHAPIEPRPNRSRPRVIDGHIVRRIMDNARHGPPPAPRCSSSCAGSARCTPSPRPCTPRPRRSRSRSPRSPARPGTPLVEPVGRRVRLTPAGRRLADHAVTILAAVDAARLDLDPDAEPAGSVRVAGFATAIRRSLLPAVADLATTAPGASRCASTSTSRSRPSTCSSADEVDLALVYDYNLAPALPQRRRRARGRCGRCRGGSACPPTGRRTSRATDLAEYADHDWIVNSRNTADEEAVRTLASLVGFTPRVVHRIDSLELVEDLIDAGRGVGLLPARPRRDPPGPGAAAGRPGCRPPRVRRGPPRPRASGHPCASSSTGSPTTCGFTGRPVKPLLGGRNFTHQAAGLPVKPVPTRR